MPRKRREGPEAREWRLLAEQLEEANGIVRADGKVYGYLCDVADRIDTSRHMLFRPDYKPCREFSIEQSPWWNHCEAEGEDEHFGHFTGRILAAWFLYHMAMEEGV